MFQGNLLEPKKGKLIGSAADMTIEYLDIYFRVNFSDWKVLSMLGKGR